MSIMILHFVSENWHEIYHYGQWRSVSEKLFENCSCRVSILLAVLQLLHSLNHSCHGLGCPGPCVTESRRPNTPTKGNDRLKGKVLQLFGCVGLPAANKEIFTAILTPCISIGLNYFWWSQWYREKIWFLLWHLLLFLLQKDFKVWLKK